MGAGGSTKETKTGLEEANARVESKAGKIVVSSRYHRLPKRLEEDYIVEEKVLGTGYNGKVFLATSQSSKEKFAVKSFTLHGLDEEKRAELINEVEIFLQLDHPHIARLVGVYENKKQLQLVMELMGGGELFDRVKELKRFQKIHAAHAVHQMLLAISYIHSKGVVHRDLKLENFLYEKKDTDHLKLIDFGFSKIWAPSTKMQLSCGTLAYVAPEVLKQKYTSQCDLWSLGVVVFILLMGYMPFSGQEDEQMQNILRGNYKVKRECFDRVSKTGQDFVKNLLQLDPTKRLTAETALQHEWITTRDKLGQVDSSVGTETIKAMTDFAKASQFRRACMSVMAWSLTNEERAQCREAFLELDKNKKGTITVSELKMVLTEQFHVTDDNFKEIFEAIDTSNNEEIHYTEFLAAMVSTRIAMHDDMLVKTFRRFDVDNSGTITADNLKQVLGESFDGKEVETIMKEADLRQDGVISLEEFIAYLKGTELSNHTEVAGKIIDTQLRKEKEGVPTRIARGLTRISRGGTASAENAATTKGANPPPEKSSCCVLC